MLLLEAFVFGAPVITVMLGVPIWRSISDCRKGRTSEIRLLRWWLVCGLIIFISMLSGLAFGVAGFVLSNLPPPPSPKPSQLWSDCRILSSGIDLRWSKICTPRSFSRAEDSIKMRSKFRCYFEYYWACVFKVEFRPYSSELPVTAVLEVPKVALPAYCRPDFGPVWVLKEKYQVNRTYPCKYTPGHLEMVDIGDDLFAKCKLEKITPLNLFKQALMVLFFSDQWIFSSTSQAGIALRKVLGYISYAACYSALITGFARIVGAVRSMLYGTDRISNIDKAYFEVRLQLTCMFVASVLWAIWYNGHMEDLNFFISRVFAVAL